MTLKTLLLKKGFQLVSFDQYESNFHDLCEIYFGTSKSLLEVLGLEQEFKKIQHFVKLWDIPILPKSWKPNNHAMMVMDNHTLIARCSIFYAFYMQGLKIETPIHITKYNGEYIIAPGYNKYILNSVFPELQLSALVLDFDKSESLQPFQHAKLINDKNIVMKSGHFHDPVYWYFVQDHKNETPDYDTISSKFSNNDTKEDYWSYRLEFVREARNFERELTFYYKGHIVAELLNGKPKLNVELYNLAGVCQFIVKHFCGYDNFSLEDQYRIM